MAAHYQIRIKGQLDPKLSTWFGDFTITHTSNGDTLLTGSVIDQAALYGILTRCRDMGVTLISINPINKETTMNNEIHAEASRIIDASPEALYAIISDYRVGHRAILPKQYFTDMTVEKGGTGAGTVIRVYMNVMGVKQAFHQVVTEPEPGRVIVETDLETGQYSTFTLDPLNGGEQTRVTIATCLKARSGIAGYIEKLMNPPITRRIFKTELENLAEYVRNVH